MLFLPPLMTAAGAGFDRLGGGPKILAISVTLMGLQTLALENLIQVVYPV
jgi:methylthioxylose transferase